MQGGGAAFRLRRRFALSGCFLVPAVPPAVEGNAALIGNIDNARSLVINLNHPFSGPLLLSGACTTFLSTKSFRISAVSSWGSVYLRIFLHKLLKVVPLLFAAVNQLLQIKDRRILPLCFVLGRRLVKPFCRKPARYHILIDPFKKRIQVLIPALLRYNVYLCLFDRQLSSCIGIFLLTNAASNCWI